MAYDEFLADRVRRSLGEKQITYREMKMMGGLCFMVDDKMCVGVLKSDLMARINPNFYSKALDLKGCKPMDFTGRVLKGFVLITPEGIDHETELDYWLQKCLEYNPLAKSSKRKK